MATNARCTLHLAIGAGQRVDGVRQPGMAPATVLLYYAPVIGMHLNLVGKVARRERQRMKKTISGLAVVLLYKALRRVAVVTGREFAVRRIDPAVILLAHNVAIDTRLGVVRQVGGPIGIPEGKDAQARRRADQHRNHHV